MGAQSILIYEIELFKKCSNAAVLLLHLRTNYRIAFVQNMMQTAQTMAQNEVGAMPLQAGMDKGLDAILVRCPMYYIMIGGCW